MLLITTIVLPVATIDSSIKKSTNKNFLYFTAFINLDKYDIDFQYFEEGWSGELLATVHGNGRIEFEPQQKFELNSDGDYVTVVNTMRPPRDRHPYPIASYNPPLEANRVVLIEMVWARTTLPQLQKHLDTLESNH